MARRNRHIRWDRDGTAGLQKGKGRKRRPDWHHTVGSHDFDPLVDTPDAGTGAPPDGAPVPLRQKGRSNRGEAL